MSYSQLAELVTALGEPAYRADQLLRWIYQRQANSFAEMSDLPQSLRDKMAEIATLFTFTPLEKLRSHDKRTSKMLFRLEDGKTIESTLMIYDPGKASRERRTVCISTQVGCPMGCYFCATGQQGYERNLSAAEIIEQVLYFSNLIEKEKAGDDLKLERKTVTNVVFMGMGEPLANYENTWQAIVMLNSRQGFNLGARQITISTAGLVPQIRRLAAEKLHVELAVSLHAANDRLRNRLIPVNKRYPLEQLIPACREYLERTGRRPTFEYALFQDINDSQQNARELASLLQGMNCSVNLIIGNPTSYQECRPSARERADSFHRQLTRLGISSTIRISRGTDIEAGCGQLKSRNISEMNINLRH